MALCSKRHRRRQRSPVAREEDGQHRESRAEHKVQRRGANIVFFDQLASLGAEITVLTLENNVWTHITGTKTKHFLNDKTKGYFTSFKLMKAPALPTSMKDDKGKKGEKQ